MAERIVSAGVFTNEIDQSFLPAAIGEIGAAVVGPTIKGPANIPTYVSSMAEFTELFGGFTKNSYVPYTANQYFSNGGSSLLVTRTMWNETRYVDSGSYLLQLWRSGSASTGTPAQRYNSENTHTAWLLPTAIYDAVEAPLTGDLYVVNENNKDDYAAILGATNSYLTSSLLLNSGSFLLKISGGYDGSVPGFDANSLSFKLNKWYVLSFNPADTNHIGKIIPRKPDAVNSPFYLKYLDEVSYGIFNAATGADGDENVWFPTGSSAPWYRDSATGYKALATYASTPYVVSQQFTLDDEATELSLFRFHTLSYGDAANYEVKIGIRDIRTAEETGDPDGYGAFSVEVRRVNNSLIPKSPFISNDTDLTPEVLEQYNNVNLNPKSVNYIGRKIGDKYEEVDESGNISVYGSFPVKSKYIRVQMIDAVANGTMNKQAIPFGFGQTFIAEEDPSSISGSFVGLSILTTQYNGTEYNPNRYHGMNYDHSRNVQWLTDGFASYTTNTFNLSECRQSIYANFPSATNPYSGSIGEQLISGSGYFTQKIALSTRKFMLLFQGGHDGCLESKQKFIGTGITSTNSQGFDLNGLAADGSKSYDRAFKRLADADWYDFNLLFVPGVLSTDHTYTTQKATQLCYDRQDALYIMDLHEQDDNIQTAVDQALTIDNNYVATYSPWVRLIDPTTNTPTWVPPSVAVAGALAFNDQTAAPWYAPAGLNRGGLSGITDTYKVLTQADRNKLYENRINPIANFPNDGIVIWGQKTLQGRPSALDRVNVRRLLIEVKKYIASATKYLVFEQNTTETREKFLAIVNPYLESVQARQGLSAFKVVMDSTNNTQAMIDQGILYGQLFLQPTRTAEFIILDFNILPTGAAFPE